MCRAECAEDSTEMLVCAWRWPHTHATSSYRDSWITSCARSPTRLNSAIRRSTGTLICSVTAPRMERWIHTRKSLEELLKWISHSPIVAAGFDGRTCGAESMLLPPLEPVGEGVLCGSNGTTALYDGIQTRDDLASVQNVCRYRLDFAVLSKEVLFRARWQPLALQLY